MKMKQILISIILTGAIITSALFGVPMKAATTYSAGILVRALGDSAVYYVASDGKKYAFPDGGTFHTWYANFKSVKKITVDELKRIPTAKSTVTARPGVVLLKFAGSPAVYAVARGAVIRPLSSQNTATNLYGREWRKFIIHLPVKASEGYVLGQIINEDDTDYNRLIETASTYTFDEELISRSIIAEPKVVAGNTNTAPSRLKSIKENLKDNISPNFVSSTYRYSVVATYLEETVNLTLTADVSDEVIKVNDLPATSNKIFPVQLSVGANEIKIAVSAPNRESVVYYLNIIRNSPDKAVYLKTLTEDLLADLSPKFDSQQFQYTIQARNYEEAVVFKPESTSKDATIYINGAKINSGSKYSVPIDYGDNDIRIDVISPGGTSRNYHVKVSRNNYSDATDSELSDLTVGSNSKTDLSPRFSSIIYNYDLSVKSTDKTVAVKATPFNSKATVTINGQVKTSLTVTLEPANLFTVINIEVRSPSGAVHRYKVNVSR